MVEGVTIEQLRTLLAVAEAGSFSAGARKLGRVQAAVSQSIERLETQLGLRLFDRSGRIPRLTRAGDAVVAAASKAVREVDALGAVAETLRRGDETRLSLIVDVLFPTASLVEFARAFAEAHPSVELVVATDVLSAVTAHVRAKRSSWGIAIEDADLDGLESRRIAEVTLVPVAARRHALAIAKDADGGRALDRRTLGAAVQIVLGPHDEAAGKGRPDHGVFSSRTWCVADLATKHALIRAGIGWGHMPEHVVRDDLRRRRLVELPLEAWGEAPIRRSLLLVQRKDGVLGPVARWAQRRLGELCRREISHAT